MDCSVISCNETTPKHSLPDVVLWSQNLLHSFRLYCQLTHLVVPQILYTTIDSSFTCRTQLEQVKLEAGSSRQAQLSAQQEALRLQQENQELQEELSSTKEIFTHMQEQVITPSSFSLNKENNT